LVLVQIVPEGVQAGQVPVEWYVAILREFDTLIADPAATSLDGMTSIDTDKRSLADYFSPEAIRLLERFCKTSNQSDHGSHPSDQEMWIAFLLHVHRTNAEEVHCDTFGACLSAAGWWPEDHIPMLAHEYDFAMRLLRQADRMAGT
jgi:hypothetical protein